MIILQESRSEAEIEKESKMCGTSRGRDSDMRHALQQPPRESKRAEPQTFTIILVIRKTSLNNSLK